MRKGNCYVTCEALYHLLGGKKAGWKPMTVKHEGATHWFLSGPFSVRLDPTAMQFDTPVPYWDGRGRGFLTKQPSKRARALMRTMLYQ